MATKNNTKSDTKKNASSVSQKPKSTSTKKTNGTGKDVEWSIDTTGSRTNPKNPLNAPKKSANTKNNTKTSPKTPTSTGPKSNTKWNIDTTGSRTNTRIPSNVSVVPKVASDKEVDQKKIKKALDIFGNLKRDTIRRNSQRSAKWLINKIKQAMFSKDLTRSTPKVGGFYLFVYDAKYKDVLPFWDAAPLVIPVQFEANGFSGLNFHYIPLVERIALFNLIVNMSSNKSRRYINISYQKLLRLSTTHWKFAYKRYLYNHMRSKLLVIDRSEWNEALALPVANFQKASITTVHREFRKRFK